LIGRRDYRAKKRTMKSVRNGVGSMDEYIRGFPEEVQKILQEVRSTIKKAVPDAEETISYRMPAFRLKGILLYFAAYRRHIGLYPTASGIAAFKDELTGYKSAKGSVQFPIDQPMPLELIARIAKYRAEVNTGKSSEKRKAGGKR
jgi:uncharacterized protein YdhG (YjbR/CyaY superfamily)